MTRTINYVKMFDRLKNYLKRKCFMRNKQEKFYYQKGSNGKNKVISVIEERQKRRKPREVYSYVHWRSK
jgi:hypothetical protein